MKDRFTFNGSSVSDPVSFLNILLESKNTRLFENTAKVNSIANTVLQQINTIGLTSNDIRGPNDLGYDSYLNKIAPLIGALEMLRINNTIDSSLSSQIGEAFTGRKFGNFNFIPTVNIDALKNLVFMEGKVSDPIAFIKNLGGGFNLNFTLTDVNNLAGQVLNSQAPPAAELMLTDLLHYPRLSCQKATEE